MVQSVDLPQALRLVASLAIVILLEGRAVEVSAVVVEALAAVVAAGVAASIAAPAWPIGAKAAATARWEDPTLTQDSHVVARAPAVPLAVVELASRGRHIHRAIWALAAVSAVLLRPPEVDLAGPQAVAVVAAGLLGVDRAMPALVRRATHLADQWAVAALAWLAVASVASHRLGDCFFSIGCGYNTYCPQGDI